MLAGGSFSALTADGKAPIGNESFETAAHHNESLRSGIRAVFKDQTQCIGNKFREIFPNFRKLSKFL